MKTIKNNLTAAVCSMLLILSVCLACGCEKDNVDGDKESLLTTATVKTPAPTATPRPTFAPMPTPVPAGTDVSAREHVYDYDDFEQPTADKLMKAVIHKYCYVERKKYDSGALSEYIEKEEHGNKNLDVVRFDETGKIQYWYHTDDSANCLFELKYDESGKITECREYFPGKRNSEIYASELIWNEGTVEKANIFRQYGYANNPGDVIHEEGYGPNDNLLHFYDYIRDKYNTKTIKDYCYGENGNMISSKESVTDTKGNCLYKKDAVYYDDGSVKDLLEIEYDKDGYIASKQEIKDGKVVVPEKKDPIVYRGYVIPRLEDIAGGPYDRGNEHEIYYRGYGYTVFEEKISDDVTLDHGSYHEKGAFSYTHRDDRGRTVFVAYVNEAEEIYNYREYTYEVKDGLNLTAYVQFEDGKALYTHVEAKDANNKVVYMHDYDGEFGGLASVNNSPVVLASGHDIVEPCICWLGRERYNIKTGETTVEEKSIDLKTVLPSIPKVNVNDDWELFIGVNADILAISAYVIDADTAQVKETYQLKDNTGKITSLRELFDGCELKGASLLEIRCKTPGFNYADSDEHKTEINMYLFALEG